MLRAKVQCAATVYATRRMPSSLVGELGPCKAKALRELGSGCKTLAKMLRCGNPSHFAVAALKPYTFPLTHQSSEADRAPPFSTISTSCSVSSLSESVSRGHPFS